MLFLLPLVACQPNPTAPEVTTRTNPPELHDEVHALPVASVVAEHARANTSRAPIQAAPARDLPLRVALHRPSGAPDKPFALQFNQAVVLDPETAAIPNVAMSPQLEGTWTWASASELTFQPDKDQLTRGTRVSVQLTSFQATTNSELQLAKTFNTVVRVPHLRVEGKVANWPVEIGKPRFVGFLNLFTGQLGAGPMLLLFDQPVEPNTVASELRVTTGSGGTVGVVVERAGDAEYAFSSGAPLDHIVAVTPRRPPEEGTTLLVRPGGEKPETYGLTVHREFELGDVQYSSGQPVVPDGPLPHSALLLTFPADSRVHPRAVASAIAIEPEAKSMRTGVNGTGPWVELKLAPGTDYEVRVSEHLADALGNELGSAKTVAFRTKDLPPMLAVPSLPTLTEAGRARLEIEGRNLANITARPYSFADGDPGGDPGGAVEFAKAMTQRTADSCASYGLFETTPAASLTRWEFESNETGRATIPLPAIPGLVCWEVVAGTTGSESMGIISKPALVQTTDLGVSAKVHDGAILAWVTDLADPKPRGGVSVSLVNREGKAIAEGVTDRDGLVSLNTEAATGRGLEEPLTVVARTKKDITVLVLAEDRLSKPWQFGLKGTTRTTSLAASIFTERGAYRPGEQVQIKVIAGPTHRHQDLSLQVLDARGQQVSLETQALDVYGAMHQELTLPDSASVGGWTVRATVGDASTTHSFRVEEYRVPTFEVEVSSDDETWAAGAGIEGVIEASYLHGGSLDGREVDWEVRRRPESFRPAGYSQFVFSPDGSVLQETVASGKGRLSGGGAKVVEFSAKHPPSSGPMRYTIDANVTDVDRQTYAGRLSRVVHPAAFYVGVQSPSRGVLKTGDVLDVPIVTVDTEGAAHQGVRVEVALERVDSHTTARIGTRGAAQTLNRDVSEQLERCVVTTKRLATSCRFEIQSAGRYQVIATAKDAQHRVVTTGFRFVASGDNTTAWPRFDHERIELRADKARYAPGDTAVLMVESPFERATGLLTLERDGVLTHRVITIKGDTPRIEVPITGDHAPNVYASVVLLRGRTHDEVDATGFETGAPGFRIGYAELAVEREEQRLEVAVAPSADTTHPGEELVVDVAVTDHNGRPTKGQATVMVVDEAVLGLTAYSTPDPLTGLLPERPLGVRSADNRLELPHARRLRREALFPGGDGGDGTGEFGMLNQMLRNLFKSTAFYDADVPIDASGHAQVRFELPDNTTTYRVMAVVIDDQGRAGSADDQVVVKRPLMVQAVLPRFVYPGDQLTVEALIHNGTDSEGTVDFAAQFGGLTATQEGIEPVLVDANSHATVRIPVEVTSRGDATVAFTATLGAHTDGVEVTLPILDPGMKQSIVESRSVSGREDVVVTLPTDRVPGSESLEIVASTSSLSELKDAVDYLMGYPNGCIEQTTSRAYPLVVLEDLLPEIGVEVDPEQLRDYSEAGVRRILSFQTTSGGLSYWPGKDEPHAFATAFGLTALIEAKTRGYDVPDEALQQMGDYLVQTLAKGDVTESIPHGRIADGDTRALFVMTLGRLGRPQPAELNHLWEKRDKLTPFGLGFLGIAAAEIDPDHPLVDPILAAVGVRAEVDASQAWYQGNAKGGYSMDSPLRSHATALLAYAKGEPSDEMSGKLLTGLLDRRRGGMWGNTQENVFGIMGVHALAVGAQQEGAGPIIDLVRNGEAVDVEGMEAMSSRARRASFGDIEQSEQVVSLVNRGGAPVNLTVRAAYELQLTDDNRAGVDNGFAIERTYETVDGEPVDLESIPLGSLVRVRLRYATERDLNYVALDDKLPAGLEPLNTNLATTQTVSLGKASDEATRSLSLLSYQEIRDHRVAFYVDSMPAGTYEYSYVARATTPGTFLRPPASAEAMYAPEVNGRSDIDEVRIR